MKNYEICKATVEDYLMLLGLSRIKIQDAGSRDEDIVIPTALSIRQAYIVTKTLDRLFSKPRCALRLAGYLCRLDGVESIISEIQDLQAERKEAFEPFARLCDETESGIAVRHVKPCEEWLDAVVRFNSLLTREELLFRLILSTVAANVKDGEFQRAGGMPVEQLLANLKDGYTEADRKRDEETRKDTRYTASELKRKNKKARKTGRANQRKGEWNGNGRMTDPQLKNQIMTEVKRKMRNDPRLAQSAACRIVSLKHLKADGKTPIFSKRTIENWMSEANGKSKAKQKP